MKLSKLRIIILIIIIILLNTPRSSVSLTTDPLKMKSTDEEEKAIVNQLVELKSKSNELVRAMAQLDKKLDEVDLEIQNNQRNITQTEIDLKNRNKILNKRAAIMYKQGTSLGNINILFGTSDAYEMMTKIDLFNFVVNSDINNLKQIKNKKKTLVKLKESFLTNRQKIVTLKEEKEKSFTQYIITKENLKKKLKRATAKEIQKVNKWMNVAKEIENFLTSRNSPMASSSEQFVLAGKKYGVNPKLIVAISGIESSFGKKNIALHNAWGRKAKGGGYNSYASWKDAIWDQASYLKRRYFDRGLITVEQIAPVYCPPNYRRWAERVNYFMGLI